MSLEVYAMIYAAIGILIAWLGAYDHSEEFLSSWDGFLYVAVHVLFWPAVIVLYAVFFGAELLSALRTGDGDCGCNQEECKRNGCLLDRMDSGGGF